MTLMADYLCIIITSPDDKHSVQHQGKAVPGIGHDVTVRDGDGNEVFGGKVESVHWSYNQDTPGAVVSVWLK